MPGSEHFDWDCIEKSLQTLLTSILCRMLELQERIKDGDEISKKYFPELIEMRDMAFFMINQVAKMRKEIYNENYLKDYFMGL